MPLERRQIQAEDIHVDLSICYRLPESYNPQSPDMLALRQSIEQQGLMQAIQVRMASNREAWCTGKRYVMDQAGCGVRRLIALRQMGRGLVEANVIISDEEPPAAPPSASPSTTPTPDPTPTPTPAAAQTPAPSAQRPPLLSLCRRIVAAYRKLQQEEHPSPVKELGRMLSMSEGRVINHIHINELPSVLRKKFLGHGIYLEKLVLELERRLDLCSEDDGRRVSYSMAVLLVQASKHCTIDQLVKILTTSLHYDEAECRPSDEPTMDLTTFRQFINQFNIPFTR